MRSSLGFLNGIVFTVALVAAAAFVGVETGALPAGADAKPLPGEAWAAKTSLHASIARGEGAYTATLAPTDANLVDGVHAYAANCAVCHGASDAKASNLAKGFYIAAPQLAKDGVEDDPLGVTFWKLKHGIRFTAMPAFEGTLSDDTLWKIALFLKTMDKLPPAADAEWKKVPSSAQTPS